MKKDKSSAMNPLKIRILIMILGLITFISLNSCQKRAVCPAYQHIDPTKKNINMSAEKFVNTTKNMTEAERKKDIEKRKSAELNQVHNRKKSLNLFPSHMR